MKDCVAGVLARFARLLVTSADPAEILALLAAAGVQRIGTTGAVVLRLFGGAPMRVVACHGISLPPSFFDEELEPGAELVERLLRAAGGGALRLHSLPLVSDGALYGIFVLVLSEDDELEEDEIELAEGLADLAGCALSKAEQLAALRRKNADLEAAHRVLVRNEKLRLIGELAAGTTHDLGNILNPLGLHVHLLMNAEDLASVRQHAERMQRIIGRGAETLERLRSYSRDAADAERLVPLELDPLVAEVIELVRPRVRHRAIELAAEAGAPPPILAPSSELLNAIVNLVVNAMDALPEAGGTIVVRTDAGEGVSWVEVEDTGIGMSPEVQARVFEPFFSTKGRRGRGSGCRWCSRS